MLTLKLHVPVMENGVVIIVQVSLLEFICSFFTFIVYMINKFSAGGLLVPEGSW